MLNQSISSPPYIRGNILDSGMGGLNLNTTGGLGDLDRIGGDQIFFTLGGGSVKNGKRPSEDLTVSKGRKH